MKSRRTRAFRPSGDPMERRFLTAALPPMRAALMQRLPHQIPNPQQQQNQHRLIVQGQINHQARIQQQPQQTQIPQRNRPVDPALRVPAARPPGVIAPGPNGPTTPIGAGFLGNQGGPIARPAQPAANINYGLVTITNTTQADVAFSISASTYQQGRFFDFTLKPGQKQVFYAPYGGPFNSAPTFQTSFDLAERRNVTVLADTNTVYASKNWVPSDPSLGRPYAIVADATGLNIVRA